MAQVFAYGARCPAFDANCKTDYIGDFDDFIAKLMCEVASILSISAGKHISIAMAVENKAKAISAELLEVNLKNKLEETGK